MVRLKEEALFLFVLVILILIMDGAGFHEIYTTYYHAKGCGKSLIGLF